MIKLILIIIFLIVQSPWLMAADTVSDDQAFINELNSTKNPFEDGFPRPVAPVIRPVYHYVAPVKRIIPVYHYHPPRRVIIPHVVILPNLHLEGVIVSDDIHQAIINDQVVPLNGIISGTEVIAVTKEGVEIKFQGKKFFLKVD